MLPVPLPALHASHAGTWLRAAEGPTRAIGKGEGRIIPAMRDGALTQLITGLLLVATIEMGHLFEVNNFKIGVKLLITIIITVLVFVYRKRTPAPNWVLWVIGLLTLTNVVLAVAWR